MNSNITNTTQTYLLICNLITQTLAMVHKIIFEKINKKKAIISIL